MKLSGYTSVDFLCGFVVAIGIALLAMWLVTSSVAGLNKKKAQEPVPIPPVRRVEHVKSQRGLTVAYIITDVNGDRYLINSEGGAPVKLSP